MLSGLQGAYDYSPPYGLRATNAARIPYRAVVGLRRGDPRGAFGARPDGTYRAVVVLCGFRGGGLRETFGGRAFGIPYGASVGISTFRRGCVACAAGTYRDVGDLRDTFRDTFSARAARIPYGASVGFYAFRRGDPRDTTRLAEIPSSLSQRDFYYVTIPHSTSTEDASLP